MSAIPAKVGIRQRGWHVGFVPISDMVSLAKITWPSPAETDFHRRVGNTIYAPPDFLKYKLSTKLTRLQHTPATAPGKGLVFPSQNKEK